MSASQSLRAVVEEKFVQSKTGRMEDCEDSIHVCENFIAVIDGATSKTDRLWGHETGGRTASKMIRRAFREMPFDTTARQAADLMTSMIHDLYESLNVVQTVKTNPNERISAAFCAVSLFRQEVWLIGDCQVILGNQSHSHPKKVDQILSEARALFLYQELLQGATLEELCRKDTGREFIMPLLIGQSLFQNNPDAYSYGYPAVDGFPIPDPGIIIRPIPAHVESAVMATDGYPFLKANLRDSENALEDVLLVDPLLIWKYKSTKGKLKGHVSFDDRAFIKMELRRPSSQCPTISES